MQNGGDRFEAARRELRSRMKRAVDVPSSARWRLEHAPLPTVVAEVHAAHLGQNLQSNSAAAPTFALCLAWWFEHFEFFDEAPVGARIEVTGGPVPDTPHGRRSVFVLHELARLLPGRFTCVPAPTPAWPARPSLNAAIADRDAGARPERGGEHAIEVAFTRQSDIPEQFAPIEAVEPFRRQLPLGLFDGKPGRASRWSPGGASQVDLWTCSTDGRTAHLFELKDADNCTVGILPEAFWYARLLHCVRTEDFGGLPVSGGGPEVDAIRRAKRIVMWLLVQDLHPLVFFGGVSPMTWLNAAMAGSGITLGVLPYTYESGRLRLRPDVRWGGP